MKYRVSFEAIIRSEVTVEAESYEAAVVEASKQVQIPTVQADTLQPTWVGTEEHVEQIGEFEYEILDSCGRCGTPIVSREIPGQPWTWTGDPENDHGPLVCYSCFQKYSLKEKAGAER